jgi:hypothetical protein
MLTISRFLTLLLAASLINRTPTEANLHLVVVRVLQGVGRLCYTGSVLGLLGYMTCCFLFSTFLPSASLLSMFALLVALDFLPSYIR